MTSFDGRAIRLHPICGHQTVCPEKEFPRDPNRYGIQLPVAFEPDFYKNTFEIKGVRRTGQILPSYLNENLRENVFTNSLHSHSSCTTGVLEDDKPINNLVLVETKKLLLY